MVSKLDGRNLFDHLYDVFCNNLRELGKASSFCELIKKGSSDLNRINALSKVCNIVLLVKSVKKCMRNNTKNAERAQEILEMYYAKKDVCSESENDLIVLLNAALADITIENELNFEQFKDFSDDETSFIENLLEPDPEISCTFEESLLSEIHSERAIYFYNVAEYEVCLVEALRAVFYARINRTSPSENLFPLLYLVSASLWHLNHFKIALNVLQLSIKLLRISALDNAAKSVQTIKLVKLMKQVQISSNNAGGTNGPTLNLQSCLEPNQEKIPQITVTSDVLISAHKSLELKLQADQGRHVTASEAIPLGKYKCLVIRKNISSHLHSRYNNHCRTSIFFDRSLEE